MSKQLLAAGICLFLLLGSKTNLRAQTADTALYPSFSWDKVPVAAFIGKTADPFTEEELAFLTGKFPLIFLSNAHNMRKMKSTEAGIAADAVRLKKMNPSVKVFFYWNTFIDYSDNYEAGKTFLQHDDWALRDQKGDYVMVRKWKRFDQSNPALRQWWSDVAANELKNPALDGVFIDAIPQLASRPAANARIWGKEKQAQLEQGLVESIQLLRKKTADKKLIIYNGLRGTPGSWPDGGSRYLAYTHGALVEHFPSYGEKNKATTARDIELIIQAGKKGKIVIVKGWPEFNWMDSAAMKEPYEKQQQLAREQLLFPLACYLIAAQPYSYFCYSWGYREKYGTFAWYQEFDKPLGKPLSDALKKGWLYTRSFENAEVTVDLEKWTAKINWKK